MQSGGSTYTVCGGFFLSERRSDLHDVAEDIASRYELDCDRIRRGLLQKWISEPTEAGGSRGVEGGGNASPEMGTGTDSPLSLAGLLDDEEDDDEAEEGAGVVGKSEADRWCNSYGQTSSTTFYYDDNLNRAVRVTAVDGRSIS